MKSIEKKKKKKEKKKNKRRDNNGEEEEDIESMDSEENEDLDEAKVPHQSADMKKEIGW